MLVLAATKKQASFLDTWNPADLGLREHPCRRGPSFSSWLPDPLSHSSASADGDEMSVLMVTVPGMEESRDDPNRELRASARRTPLLSVHLTGGRTLYQFRGLRPLT